MAATRRGAPTWEEFAAELGHNLHRARLATGLSQERIAHAAGISSYTYQKLEKGESRPGVPLNPRLVTLLSLCQVLGVGLEDVVPDRLPDLTAGG